ncbi:Fe-S cluster assembly protein SufB [Candidatus Gottesmanbacteria bacterium]|nr:Fe-S cluster assembly protein SufB [Candidatus Gottesmanbacteria bacterium]
MQPSLVNKYKYGFREPEKYIFKSRKGLNRKIVEEISWQKKEPAWMRDFRLRSLTFFERKPMPTWGGDLTGIDFDNIYYYLKPIDKKAASWEELPVEIKRTYDRIGIPQAEKKMLLGGVSAQWESEVVYKSIQKSLSKKGVIFLDMDSGLREYPELVRQYFGTVIPPLDNKFAALNSSVWSGGSFIYVPKGVSVELPLQAYFRINAANMGQFERTLIIADEGSFVHYVEGCLPAGEQVSLGDKWVNIESIKPSDLVVSEDGKLHKVKAIMVRNYKGNLINIRPVSPYNKFKLTPEHPVLVVKRSNVGGRIRNNWLAEVNTKKLLKENPKYIRAGELEKGDFIVFPKISPSVQINFADDELFLLGLYLAEGSTYIHNKLKVPIVAFSLNEKEKTTIERLIKTITVVSSKKPMIIKDSKKHAVEIRVYSKMLRDLCLTHCSKGAANKILSTQIMQLTGSKLKIFLDSYWLGDGNILKRKNGRSILMRASTASEALARQIQELFARLGMFLSIQIREASEDYIAGRKIFRKTQYVLTYTPKKQWSEVRETKNYFLVPIREITKTDYHGPVFNLDVLDLNSYLTRGFVVHNCTAPIYTTDSLHSAVVEIIVKKGARVRYTTIQNWSTNVYNLVTKRMVVGEEAVGEWVDCNLGSKLTMKYPSVYLMGRGARGEVLSIAYAGKNQHQDAGGKAIHMASDTSSRITSKSISKDGGRTSYRGLLHVSKGAKNVKSKVVCDALILDPASRSDTYPTMKIEEDLVQIEHEATVSKIGEEQLFYLKSRGLTTEEAEAMVVNGFIEPIVKELPLEYAVEMNRLIQLQMEGSVG